MPSFDIVSETDLHELSNAVDQSNRELGTRYDFKNIDASFEIVKDTVKLSAENEFQVQQMLDILKNKMTRRSLDIRSLVPQEIQNKNLRATQHHDIVNGLSKEDSKKITKLIKEEKFKVKASIMDDMVRVDGKKKDDLQMVMQFLKEKINDLPLQYKNFKD